MSDPKHEGYVGPNDPAYYAPRELRERAASGQSNVPPEPTEEWRSRVTTEEVPPLQPLTKPPQRRDDNEIFTRAVAQAMQESMEPPIIEAPSVLRDMSGRRALFDVVIRFSIAAAIAAGVALMFVMAFPMSQGPAGLSIESPSISSLWQSMKSSVLPAPQPQRKRVATLTVQDSSGLVNDPMPIGVSVGAPPPGALVAVNGLAPGARLTSGKRIASNEWRVPASEISAVSVIPPEGFVGQMAVTVELRDGDGVALANSSARLSWAAPASVAAAAPAIAVAPKAVAVAVAPAAPALPPVASRPPQTEIVRNLDPKEIAGLIRRGQDLLSSGDILSARLLLQRGAEARDARSALLLGTTYDPSLLKQLGASGPLEDIAQARNWYQKAREWGAPDAQRQLDALALAR